jgi:GNAT superfamily N-acetyltransferase
MAAVTQVATPTLSSGRLRAFDVRRDLAQVADLVEQCFADTLDPDGQNYLHQMRAAAANPGYLRWASAMTERVSLPLSGYVWEENGRLVGNLTLIPFLSRRQRCYLIANVAVHPDYRRRGIAREMTVAAIQYTRQRGAPSVWLHVREENEAAIQLYENLGFQERACRTTWHTGRPAATPLDQKVFHTQPEEARLRRETASLRLEPRRSRHWEQQRQWLGRLYPPELTWHLSIRAHTLRPGLSGVIQRFFTNQWIQQWSAVEGDELCGVLTWQSTHSYADALWLATVPEYEQAAAFLLLANARQRLPTRRALALDYPAHQAEEAIRAAGFHIHQTLIWMAISSATGK